jgi:hypothetical protein
LNFLKKVAFYHIKDYGTAEHSTLATTTAAAKMEMETKNTVMTKATVTTTTAIEEKEVDLKFSHGEAVTLIAAVTASTIIVFVALVILTAHLFLPINKIVG